MPEVGIAQTFLRWWGQNGVVSAIAGVVPVNLMLSEDAAAMVAVTTGCLQVSDKKSPLYTAAKKNGLETEFGQFCR